MCIYEHLPHIMMDERQRAHRVTITIKCKSGFKINNNDLIIKENDWDLSDAIGSVSVDVLLKLVMSK